MTKDCEILKKLKKIILIVKMKLTKHIINAIKEAGGTMPEDLPTPKKSLKELEKNNLLSNKEST